MGKSAPAPPNFSAAAGAQTAANRPDQSNPFGSTTWDPTHSTQTTAFSGALAPLAGNLSDQAGSAWSKPLDNGQQARTDATNSLYSQATSRLDPQWNLRQQANTASLANAGLDPDSQAAQAQTDTLNRAQNDAYSSAENNAVSGGANAAAQQQQLDLNSREAPLSALSGLKGLLSMPGYGQAGDLLGADQDQWNANLGAFNANGGPLGGFGSLLQALTPLVGGIVKGGSSGGAGAAPAAGVPA